MRPNGGTISTSINGVDVTISAPIAYDACPLEFEAVEAAGKRYDAAQQRGNTADMDIAAEDVGRALEVLFTELKRKGVY